MTWADIVERQRGTLWAGLVVEGLPVYFTTSAEPPASFDGVAPDGEPLPILDHTSVAWSYGADFRNGDIEASNITFRLFDAPSTGAHTVTKLLTGIGGANTTGLAASLTAAGTSITVDSTAGFTVPGVLYLNGEAIHVTGIAAGPPRFTGATRGYYYSQALQHLYQAPSGEDLGITSIVSDQPITWIGRRVRLYLSEVLPDGTLDTPTQVWVGQVDQDLTLATDGVTWDLACRHAWNTLDTKIGSNGAVGYAWGLVLEDVTINWSWDPDVAGGVPVDDTYSGSFSLSESRFESAEEFVSTLNSDLADDLALEGVTDEYVVSLEEGHIKIAHAAGGVGTGRLLLWSSDDTTQAILGVENLAVGRGGEWTSPVLAPDGAVRINPVFPTTIYVDDASKFPTYDDDGGTYRIRACVWIDGRPFYIESSDAGTDTLEILPVWQPQEAGEYPDLIVLVPPGGRFEVRFALEITGNFVDAWQAFIESSGVADVAKGGLDTRDFDWDELASYDSGGVGSNIAVILHEPVSFSELFVANLRFAGLTPAVSATGLISARPVAAPTLSASVTTIDENSHSNSELPTLGLARDPIVNQVRFESYDDLSPAHPGLFSTVNNKTSQALFRHRVWSVEIASKSNFVANLDALSVYAASVASGYFALYGAQAWTGDLPCSIRPALLLPGDTALVTHATWPDTNTGERGITGSLALVTKISVEPFAAKTTVTVWISTEDTNRAGWAPAVRISDYVDNGGGAGDQRYELVVTPGLETHYSTGFDASYFKEGMKVLLTEWLDESPTTISLTVSAAESAVDGTAVYVTSAPGTDPGTAGGTWILTLDAYDTASQTTEAKTAYVHICDEDDKLIATTSDTGFKPA